MTKKGGKRERFNHKGEEEKKSGDEDPTLASQIESGLNKKHIKRQVKRELEGKVEDIFNRMIGEPIGSTPQENQDVKVNKKRFDRKHENKNRDQNDENKQGGKSQILTYPTETLIAKPGETINVGFEILTGIHWAWKGGAFIQSDLSEQAKLVLEDAQEAITYEQVIGDDNQHNAPDAKFRVSLPIKFKENAAEQTVEAHFQLMSKKGKAFGNKISLKVKVCANQSDATTLQVACALFSEQSLKAQGISFQDVLTIVRNNGNDKVKSLKAINQKQAGNPVSDIKV